MKYLILPLILFFCTTSTAPLPTLTLTAVGDIMLGRYVGRRIEQLGATYPFSATQLLLQGDLLLGNLESPPTMRRAPAQQRPGPYRLPADPASVAGLRAAGFDALALANNHALDAGPQGLQEAAGLLEQAAITPLGIGADSNTAYMPHFVSLNGLRVALLAANDVRDPADEPAEASSWGRAWLNETLLAAVRDARTHADLVVLLIHWGSEYAPQPSPHQRSRAAELVAAGADLVLGSHPHVLQPVEWLEAGGRRGLIAYSLGNFVFDQGFSAATSQSAVLHVTLDRTGVRSYSASPVTIINGQPRPLAPTDAAYADVMAALGIGDWGLGIGGFIPQSPTPNPQSPTTYTWNGTTFTPHSEPVAPSALSTQHSALSTQHPLPLDLRGDGTQLLLTLTADGLAELHDGPTARAPVVWRNERADWHITQAIGGDADGDGRWEYLLLLWKPDEAGVLHCHPFLLGWRGGRYRIFWGGSAVAQPIQAAALGDLDGDGRAELAVIEGGRLPGEVAERAAVWRWHGWGFERVWTGPPATLTRIELRDVSGDGVGDLVVSNK